MIEWLGDFIISNQKPIIMFILTISWSEIFTRFSFRNFEVEEMKGVWYPEMTSGNEMERFWGLFKYSLRHSILVYVPITWCIVFIGLFLHPHLVEGNQGVPRSVASGYIFICAALIVFISVFLRETFRVRMALNFAMMIFREHGAEPQAESISEATERWRKMEIGAMFFLFGLFCIPILFHSTPDVGLALLGALAIIGVNWLYALGVKMETQNAKELLHEAVEEFYRELDSRGADGQSHGGDQPSRYQGPFLVSDVK